MVPFLLSPWTLFLLFFFKISLSQGFVTYSSPENLDYVVYVLGSNIS